MLKEKVRLQKDMEDLIQELEGISSDMSSYLEFLLQRRYLMQQMIVEEPASKN